MPSLSQCDRDRLRQLLDGALEASVETDVTQRVGTCEVCRRQLESFAADESWWQGTREALSEESDSNGAWSLNEPADNSPPNIPLDFLSPSDNPAMLGRLGEFEILEWIGCGGMGIVLKGYDHELNRYVAVKVLHPHCATSAAARRRFAREAQAAAAVVHQHVVAIYAVDGQHHPPYLVMPFVPGESLQQRLNRKGAFEVVDVLRIGQQVAEGLAAAHAQGLVHRDIKPGNILLERNVERVLLTDFGLARAADDASLTQSGVIAGTPQFMSPEQAHGEQIDHRTDLFSLGTVLYTLLAGHSPFRAETTMGVLRRVCEDTPRPLREINPNVPVWLEAFIEKLHAKKPSLRFDDAQTVAEQLKGCLAHVQEPTLVPLPIQIAELTKHRRQRNQSVFWPSIAVGLAAISLLVVVAGLWATKQPPRSHNDPKNPDPFASQLTTEATVWDDQFQQKATEIDRSLQKLESQSMEEF
ncbi:MAG: serine/threonine-protein kinase [Schlesneria sp.]